MRSPPRGRRAISRQISKGHSRPAFTDQASDFLYALADFVKGRLATAFFNYESPELLGVSQISQELKGSHLVDDRRFRHRDR